MTVVHQHHHRGPWQPGPKDSPAPTCPGCGGILETGPTETGTLIGVCTNPMCGEWVILRAVEGRWTVGERIRPDQRRRTAGPARPGAIGPAAG